MTAEAAELRRERDELAARLEAQRYPENGPEYVTATAEMIRRRYPEQAAEVLPRLREIWRAKMKKKYGGK